MTGGVHSITGSETLNARLVFAGLPPAGLLLARLRRDGQWFQRAGCVWASEGAKQNSGLHYNWHRHYDPTIGRYTQPDPLGFVDGPSVYAYAGNAPGEFVDPDGQAALPIVLAYCRLYPAACAAAAAATGEAIKNICEMAAGDKKKGHTSKKRPSTREDHEDGDARRGRDQGGEKADQSQGGPRRPPLQKPHGWKGPWPPR